MRFNCHFEYQKLFKQWGCFRCSLIWKTSRSLWGPSSLSAATPCSIKLACYSQDEGPTGLPGDWGIEKIKKKILQLLLNLETEVRRCRILWGSLFTYCFLRHHHLPMASGKWCAAVRDITSPSDCRLKLIKWPFSPSALYGMITVICEWLQHLNKRHINLWSERDKRDRGPCGWSVWIWIALLGPFPRLQGKQAQMHGSIHNKLMILNLCCAIKIWLH